MRIFTISAIVLTLSSVTPYSSTQYSDVVEHGNLSASSQIGPGLMEFIQVSNRCFTPQFWCYLPGNAPVGARCWCATPYGPVEGVVR